MANHPSESINPSINPDESTFQATPATSTDGAGGVSDGQWFVGWVAPRAEKVVRDKLLKDNVVAYAAVRRELHIWRRNERRMVDSVIIPCVVFIKTKPRALTSILKTYPVTSFMMDRARKKEPGQTPYAIVSNQEMRLLKAMLGQEEFDVSFAPSHFTLGEHVRIIGIDTGDDLPQIVTLPGDHKTYVGVRVNFLGCAYMQVPIARIIKLTSQ